jgi:guanylate kinase
MRPTEKNGTDYYFMTASEFRKKIEAQDFIEWEEVYQDRYYGTLKSEIERIENENCSAIFDVDVEGGLQIKKYFGDNLLTVFIRPSRADDLKERLIARNTETPESLQKRLDKSIHELTYEPLFDNVIINDDLVESCASAKKLVEDFLQKRL